MALSQTERLALEQACTKLGRGASWASGPRAQVLLDAQTLVQSVIDGKVDEAAVNEQAENDARAAEQAKALEDERKANEKARAAAEKAREKAAAKQ